MSDIKVYKVDEPYLQIPCGLGEAPIYDEENDTLRFVDVVKKTIHTVNLKEGPSSLKTFQLDYCVGTTSEIEGHPDKVIYGGKAGFGIFDKKTGDHKYIKGVWDHDSQKEDKEENMRANDGSTDSRGRFWVTYMNDPLFRDPFKPDGKLLRLDPDLSVHVMLEDIQIPNGTKWSADDKTMYFTDSPKATIYKFDFDAETGNISNRRAWYKHEDGDGQVPDGHVLDVEGHMWTAIHGGGKVIRLSPEGKVVAEIKLPTKSITCPCFVGEDLYITSMQGDPEENPDYPRGLEYAGSVFKVNVGVRGLPAPKFKPAPGVAL